MIWSAVDFKLESVGNLKADLDVELEIELEVGVEHKLEVGDENPPDWGRFFGVNVSEFHGGALTFMTDFKF